MNIIQFILFLQITQSIHTLKCSENDYHIYSKISWSCCNLWAQPKAFFKQNIEETIPKTIIRKGIHTTLQENCDGRTASIKGI